MEVFAGFGEYADFYLVGDNGASAGGGMRGMFNEMTYFNGVQETVQDVIKH